MTKEIETYDQEAWISIVPFRMSGIRFRGTPALPYFSQFPELNVRTYVKYGDKPGVYFFSLDARSAAGVFFGRKFFHLPYFYARMSIASRDGRQLVYQSVRKEGNYHFKGKYRPVSQVYQALGGTLAYWLVERYCLYSVARNQLYISEINHKPWNLQDAEYEIAANTMLHLPGINIGEARCAHYSRRNDVHIWPLRPVFREVIM